MEHYVVKSNTYTKAKIFTSLKNLKLSLKNYFRLESKTIKNIGNVIETTGEYKSTFKKVMFMETVQGKSYNYLQSVNKWVHLDSNEYADKLGYRDLYTYLTLNIKRINLNLEE